MRKVISFSGLDFQVILAPVLHGEPLVTSQAFYFLGDLESVARIRFEDGDDLPEHNDRDELSWKISYIIDNYLFAYSKKYPESRLSTQGTTEKYWEDDNKPYVGHDNNNTQVLELEILNDDDIISASNEDFPNKDDWGDWCLLANYSDEYFEKLESSLLYSMKRRIKIQSKNHKILGTGTFELPLIKVSSDLLTKYQARMLDMLTPGKIKEVGDYVEVSRSPGSIETLFIPHEKMIVTNYYDEQLLSYYFSGLKEDLPISKFRSFYNVVEFFFEFATNELRSTSRREVDMLNNVLQYFTTGANILETIRSKGEDFEYEIGSDFETYSNSIFTGLRIYPDSIIPDLAKWLYDIRCAIVHSKKTRRGVLSKRLIPYTKDERLVERAIPIIQKLAISCIEGQGERQS